MGLLSKSLGPARIYREGGCPGIENGLEPRLKLDLAIMKMGLEYDGRVYGGTEDGLAYDSVTL